VVVPFSEKLEPSREYGTTIVIVTHQSANLVAACLDGLRDFSMRLIHEVVVVDSGSSDGTLTVLKSYAKSNAELPLRIIDAHGNIGFAPAVNLALRTVTNTPVLLLNPDAKFCNDVLTLLQSVSDSTVGCIGPSILTEEGLPSSVSARQLPRWYTPLLPDRSRVATQSKIVDSEALSGACVLLTTQYRQQVPYLDETLPMYLEDLILFAESRRLGFRNVYVAAAQVEHLGAASTMASPHRRTLQVLAGAHAPFLYILRYRGRVAAASFVFATIARACGGVIKGVMQMLRLMFDRRPLRLDLGTHMQLLAWCFSRKSNWAHGILPLIFDECPRHVPPRGGTRPSSSRSDPSNEIDRQAVGVNSLDTDDS
jgi:N-acetylglucosaminyl-diphospho-decaprenol L-rhamnosyltransferase